MLAEGVTCKLLHCQARELKHAWFCRRARHEPGGRVSQTDCAGRPPLAPALRCAARPSTGAPSGKRGDSAACPAQRQKEILRNKKERRFQRDAHALKSNPEAIKEELKGVRVCSRLAWQAPGAASCRASAGQQLSSRRA